MTLLQTPPRPIPAMERHTPLERRRWVRPILLIMVGALFASVVGYLIDDQVTQRQRFDRVQASLGLTRQRTLDAQHDLAVLRHDVALLTAQVGANTASLNEDVAQLKAAATALAITQADVSEQSSRIGALHTCVGGVQEALNALAVNKQSAAVAALNSVSASCASASGG